MGNDDEQPTITIRGNGMTLADVVVASKLKSRCVLTKDTSVLQKLDTSVDVLAQQIEEGLPIYGVNTGFGGSADARTTSMVDLQKALLQLLQTGILLSEDIGMSEPAHSQANTLLKSLCLPRAVVRGSILVRCNSLIRGHSAVRRDTIERLLKLLNMDHIPVVPLRGSVSASGDLMPLAYIAGALEGDPGVYIDRPVEHGSRREIVPADEALRNAGMVPMSFSPKEGLGIVNGTVVSSTLATLALHEAQYLALLAQALTGMCTEAIRGSADNFHPFIAASRPHPGQIEAAANILHFLGGSKLTTSRPSLRDSRLAQDRYPIRTASQWIAPYLEDLGLAASQLEVELNSTSDNPLVDTETRQVHNGGNFQATSVTSATEKTRLSLQMLGKLFFTQNSELINPMMNEVLPANLSFDDPSLSFTFKGIDINMAAYMSELAFLASPVSPHVQCAEMNNQAINSLALISARYTLDAVEIASMMSALHLYTCCQALDLQVMHITYVSELREGILASMPKQFEGILDVDNLNKVATITLNAIAGRLQQDKKQDIHQQAVSAAEATIMPLTAFFLRNTLTDEEKGKALSCIMLWKERCVELVRGAASSVRRQFMQEGTILTNDRLSHGSRLMYNFVRDELKVPLHKGLVEHASYKKPSPEGISVPASEKALIGKQVSIIYHAIRDGKIYDTLIESLI
ncbi:Putative aromatic amino acid lyase, L-Aspartase, phenylalanine/histidine ammonia-lyase, active [Septoria linicola]|uniref:Aromatic amino acid lyase, L-Aspartase, phenylalanine/histidine ammonia-lyase, active n=1 Tax=Septoria linicola TaxID=215465 RepID=A0A9Q9ER47_9PEZI|nr:Putative aromatic amino acid lyase, L-Aspartase, phenylalanine/histidine ammonia-lyase, active [Septoria linicola]